MTNRKIYIGVFTSLFSLLLTAAPQAQESVLNEDNCKTVIKKDVQGPVRWRCEGFLKGVKYARSIASGGTSGTYTQTGTREFVVLSPGTSGTQGKKPLEDMVAINLEPGFLERRTSGAPNWATVSEIDLKDAARTVTLGQAGLDDRTLSFQKKINLEDYVAKTNSQSILKQIEKDLSEYDTNKAYTIMVPRQ